jgi:hypothetical protein
VVGQDSYHAFSIRDGAVASRNPIASAVAAQRRALRPAEEEEPVDGGVEAELVEERLSIQRGTP